MKKVICIDNATSIYAITINKEYRVISHDPLNNLYFINCDDNKLRNFKTTRFKEIKMKPKLDLNALDQNWYVKSNDQRLLGYLGIRYGNDKNFYSGTSEYYGVCDNNINASSYKYWGIEYSLEEFLEALAEYENSTWHPKVGELVEIYFNNKWFKRIYLATIPQASNPIACVHEGYEEKYLIGQPVISCNWSKMRKIEEPKIEISISCKINGIDKDPSTFTDEEWLQLRKSK